MKDERKEFFVKILLAIGCAMLLVVFCIMVALAFSNDRKVEPDEIVVVEKPKRIADEDVVDAPDEPSDIASWDSLADYIKKNGWDVSFGYYNLTTGEEVTYRADRIYYGASLVKTVDALYVYEEMQITDDLRDLVKEAIMVSDNDAHMELFEIIGYENLRAYGRALGMKNFLDTNESYEYGNTTVADQLALWKKVYNFLYTDRNADKAELESFFKNNNTNSLAFEPKMSVLHKYGYWEDACHDSGIILTDKPYILTILTNENRGGFSIISDLSEKIYQKIALEG